MLGNAAFVAFIEIGLLVLGGGMFFVSLAYSTEGNFKWLLFMSFALVPLYTLGLFIGIIGFEVLSPQLLKSLTIAQFFFLVLAASFYLAYRKRKQDDKKD